MNIGSILKFKNIGSDTVNQYIISRHIFEAIGDPFEMVGLIGTGLKYLRDLYSDEYIKKAF